MSIEPYGNGHIHDTYKTVFNQAGTQVPYLFQRINSHVFQEPIALMDNISRICNHIAHRLAEKNSKDASRQALQLVRARDGLPWVYDDEKRYWRCYLFIRNATGHEVIQSPSQAREAARCFGEYQRLLTDLPGKRLNETIPDFHNTPRRLEQLIQAVAEDPVGRASDVHGETDFFLQRQSGVGLLLKLAESGDIPERVTHNDTKLNNVLMDVQSQCGVCVIDLDTSMPGLSLYDFGDLVRTSTNPVPEDHKNPDDVRMDLTMFDALAEGFLEAGHTFMTDAEIFHLPEGGWMMTLEVGMRFLTDYILGDRYFRIEYPEHNLIRCRTQIALVRSIENQMNAMRQVVEMKQSAFLSRPI